MFAKGPQPGAQPKDLALRLLPRGTACRRVTAMGITGYVVTLPDGRAVGSAGNAGRAWDDAAGWAQRNPELAAAAIAAAGGAGA